MTNHRSPASIPCDPEQEQRLHLYLDGELAFDEQTTLFAHLAECHQCRKDMDATLAFRRFSRQEHLAVPPQADDVFLKRLATVKDRNARIDRREDRAPLWQTRKAIPLRLAVGLAAVLFIVGIWWPDARADRMTIPVYVSIEEELVETTAHLYPSVEPNPDQVYIFYPGLTVEAVKTE